jgi:hypothetical protein
MRGDTQISPLNTRASSVLILAERFSPFYIQSACCAFDHPVGVLEHVNLVPEYLVIVSDASHLW